MKLLAVIEAQRKGKCLIEAQACLQEMVKSVLDTGRKGSISIRLEIEPGAEPGTVVLRDDVIPKVPKKSKTSSTFYADDSGALHREDPNQPELPGVIQMEKSAS